MTTLTRKAVNFVNQAQGNTFTTAFNDKLKDGRRSLKVWRWSTEDYALAKEHLESLGCKVKVVKIPQHRYSFRGVEATGRFITRLHVTEPN